MWYIKASSSLHAIWFDKIKEAMQIIEFFKKNIYFIYFWWHWVSGEVCGLSSCWGGA